MTISCASEGGVSGIQCHCCGARLQSPPEAPLHFCPECGDNNFEVTDSDQAFAHEDARLRVRDSTGQLVLEVRSGGSLTSAGPTAGTYAERHQVVDRIARRYRKTVVLSNGQIAKDIEGPLDDQSLHGPPTDQRS